VVALPYAAKVTAFLERLGLPPAALAHDEHAGPLLASIDRIWDERDKHRAQLRACLPELKREAGLTARLVADIAAPRVPVAAA
jgi:hypothetical protein